MRFQRPALVGLFKYMQLATIMVLLSLAVSFNMQAQTFTILHNFTGGLDGSNPWAGFVKDTAGNLYGITSGGGGSNACNFYGTNGCGAVYKLTNKNGNWVDGPLYSFQGNTDGEFPIAAMTIGSNGTFFGTTTGGGQGTCTYDGSNGCGTIFNLKPTPTRPPTPLSPWVETVLYRFTGGSDGGNPNVGNLIFDSAGDIYGTTEFGGTNNLGVVYELKPAGGGNWTETVLYNFAGADGSTPLGGLVFDKTGNLYGTTKEGGDMTCNGGAGCGVIYELSLSGGGWTEKILYVFEAGNDGFFPDPGLIFDPAGNLYGGTYNGGAGGGGTVYELSPSGGGWTLTTLYSFPGTKWGFVNRLAMDAAGNLYGTTQYGGINGDGNVFKLTKSGSSWTYTDLHDFTYGLDGGVPVCTPVLDANGNIYGTAFGGGTNPCGGGYGCGVIWEIKP